MTVTDDDRCSYLSARIIARQVIPGLITAYCTLIVAPWLMAFRSLLEN